MCYETGTNDQARFLHCEGKELSYNIIVGKMKLAKSSDIGTLAGTVNLAMLRLAEYN